MILVEFLFRYDMAKFLQNIGLSMYASPSMLNM